MCHNAKKVIIKTLVTRFPLYWRNILIIYNKVN